MLPKVTGWTLSDLEIMAILFAVSGLVLLLALHLVVRSSPPPPGQDLVVEERPQRLDLVRQEGFEIIELYDDFLAVGARPAAPLEEAPQVGRGGERTVARTAKVRNPQSGEVRLVRVVTRRQSPR